MDHFTNFSSSIDDRALSLLIALPDFLAQIVILKLVATMRVRGEERLLLGQGFTGMKDYNFMVGM